MADEEKGTGAETKWQLRAGSSQKGEYLFTIIVLLTYAPPSLIALQKELNFG